MLRLEELRATLQERGLSSVWLAAEQCGQASTHRLALDLLQVDWKTYDRQRKALLQAHAAAAANYQPPNLIPPSLEEASLHKDAQQCGEAALREGGVAILTVAGGQASRLGFVGPKGAFPIAPLSGSSLFQLLAGQISRLRQLFHPGLPWVIQTGPGNHQQTVDFFQRHSFFGLGSTTVHFVCQGTLPALSPKGQLLLAAPDKLFRNPDGHGGVFRAMKRSGCLQKLRGQGVHTLYYCQVDNPLALVGDPIFLGHHLLAEARMSVKVVEKTDPEEKVGLVVQEGERTLCVEYSDLSAEIQAQRAQDGGLQFRAGNIAIHAFELNFMEEMAEAHLPLHLARKDIPSLTADGFCLRKQKGVKFETFVFDALPLAGQTIVQMARRDDEFAPVKNRCGVDSIATSRQALLQRTQRWLQQAGIEPPFTDTQKLPRMELQPGLCLHPADLAAQKPRLQWYPGPVLGIQKNDRKEQRNG